MSTAYAPIIRDNIRKAFERTDASPARAMGAQEQGGGLVFRAFGAFCTMTPDAILLDGQPQDGPLGVVISLYALHAPDLPLASQPFRAFKEMDGSMPYAGAFATHTEHILAPRVEAIHAKREAIAERLDGGPGPEETPGDFSFTAQPLPKIQLCYIFYLPDEDFPAAVTCLFSNNAGRFMPTDGLADVGEYTSRTILNLLKNG